MNLQKQYIKQAIEALHFINYTEVQEKVIPLFLSHKSIVVEAKTGSGKTHAYLIPIFENLDESQNVVQALICAPTRDLANQIFDFAKQIASFSDKPFDIRLFVGGRDRDQEMTRLTKSQPQIVIGTPGRLFDLIRKENLLKAHTNKVLVIDEADMALEDNFLEEIDGIASTMKEKTQMVVLSATIPQSLQPFLKKYLEAPVVIQVQKEEISNLNIKHYFVKTRERDRLDILDQILSAINPYFCIVFCNTKDSADVVHEHINTLGKKVALLHGGIEYRKRKQILSRIKALDFQFLVATDIMSRGIDIDGVSHIVNYELPKDTSFYIHRTGRTGRMSYDGVALSIYDFKDETYLDQLESKGLKCTYKEIVKREIVEAKVRNERQNRAKVVSSAEKQAKLIIKKPGVVKPGYKKKYQTKIDSVKKHIQTKRGH